MTDIKKDERCVLCLEEKEFPVLISCGHSFCSKCFEIFKSYDQYKWAKKCPICREDLMDEDDPSLLIEEDSMDPENAYVISDFDDFMTSEEDEVVEEYYYDDDEFEATFSETDTENIFYLEEEASLWSDIDDEPNADLDDAGHFPSATADESWTTAIYIWDDDGDDDEEEIEEDDIVVD
ncbi:uncharacterized protein LOC142239235 [Haematobia irritans]|uniref:uncharacterized protein LOC142239235 n=1 Tax=Haematobia irritans TaxID=7368 RepID=UPI003F50010F